MFEKSLYDLIRGLRSHKGHEAEYIQGALKECRAEIRSADMDLKATALLKMIYLEMFGHDMTWAAFNVLEVMSSPKIMQKRVGYLGAVQSFRADADILMLATNLLKKDLSSPTIPVLSMPLGTLPHIITSSLALSLLSDILPRLSHSHPSVRKKTVVTLYRLALVYPETLRVAWPKIKDKLMDENEDSSVIAAVINVVCELGWRRPHDFLPLAPRLFDLLVDGGNNWMAIKIIKLFATLTPLEPRLVKKLLRPLMNIINSTSAMSLLYECINGIIQGGILVATDGVREGEEVASLCLSKLRSMIVVEGDPNLKYVSLVAFNKIVLTHPDLVAMQQDVIMGCLDDGDISIRLQALELVSGMVSSESLQTIVDRLLRQLRNSPIKDENEDEMLPIASRIEPAADSDDDDPAETIRSNKDGSKSLPALPTEYRHEVVRRILDMCSKDAYANITDFEWYIDVLVTLVKFVPAHVTKTSVAAALTPGNDETQLAARIGFQLRDIAVRVMSLRPEATRAAESLVLVHNRDRLFPAAGGALPVLESAAWIVGEYASLLADIRQTLDSLIHDSTLTLSDSVLPIYVHAIPKVFSIIAENASVDWDAHQQTTLTLLLARIVNFLEQVANHPSLDVQERAVEFLELFRLAKDAIPSQAGITEEAPLLLTSAIPSLFRGAEINPVASGAQKKVPLPADLDLDEPINPNLASILDVSMQDLATDGEADEYYTYYHTRAVPAATRAETAVSSKLGSQPTPQSYQYQTEDPETAALRRAARRQRNVEDPFYIPSEDSGRATPIHSILQGANGEDELDVDSIPIIDLKLVETEPPAPSPEKKKRPKKKTPRPFVIAADETLDLPSSDAGSGGASPALSASPTPGSSLSRPVRPPPKPSLLQVDSSTLNSFSLSNDDNDPVGAAAEIERREQEEAEMAAAIKEVERMRLQMQRDQERVALKEGMDVEGTQVIRRKKKKSKAATAPAATPDETSTDPITATPHILPPQTTGSNDLTSAAPVDAMADPAASKKKKKVIIRKVVKKKKKGAGAEVEEGIADEPGT